VKKNTAVTTSIAGPVTIAGSLKASISCESLGDLTVLGPGDPDHPANITIRGPYANSLTVSHAIHTLHIDGDVSGPISIGGDLTYDLGIGTLTDRLFIGGDASGQVVINGLRDYAALEIGGNARLVIIQNGLDEQCAVHIGGNVGLPGFTRGFEVRTQDADPNLAVQLAGTVRIDGHAYDWHAHCWTMSTARVHIGGDVERLGFDFDVQAGAVCQVDGGVSDIVVFGIGDLQADLLGDLIIGGEVTGDIDARLGCISGNLTIGGDFTGQMDAADLTGRLAIGAYPNAIHHLSGSVHIHGDLAGDSPGDGIEVAGNLSDPNNDGTGGRIMIDGGFGETRDSTIVVHGSMAPGRPGIAVDFDGYDPQDRWGPYGTVVIGDPNDPNNVYRGNMPAMHIYEVTSCKGDGDNSGSVGPPDTVAMLLAIMGESFYRTTYPGLEGSMLFHCDITGPTNPYQCDGVIDSLDFDLLPVRFGTCSTLCGPIDAGDGPSAGELAAALNQHVPNALRPILLDVVTDLRQNHPRPVRRAYWQAVRQYLGQ
jgi:hypothetical protein